MWTTINAFLIFSNLFPAVIEKEQEFFSSIEEKKEIEYPNSLNTTSPSLLIPFFNCSLKFL